VAVDNCHRSFTVAAAHAPWLKGEAHLPLPTQLFLTFASGVLAALAARADLRVSPKPAAHSDAFFAYLLYAGLVVVPVAVYFYAFHGDWYLLYAVDTARVPSALALIGSALVVGVGAAGFLFGASLVRSQREQWAGAAVGMTVSMALGVLPLARHRLAVVGSYAQFHGDFGHHPYGGTLFYGTLCMTLWMVLGLSFLVYRLGIGAKRG
jgi:hypothetical protein